MSQKNSKTQKTKIVAFKVEEELAEFLNRLPNKSDFIRRAILDKFSMTCPLCEGSGVVARGLHTHFSPLMQAEHHRDCDKCGKKDVLPLKLDTVEEEHQERYEQFFNGGPFYCQKCYEKVPECEDCGWHIALESVAEHHRNQHLA